MGQCVERGLGGAQVIELVARLRERFAQSAQQQFVILDEQDAHGVPG